MPVLSIGGEKANGARSRQQVKLVAIECDVGDSAEHGALGDGGKSTRDR